MLAKILANSNKYIFFDFTFRLIISIYYAINIIFLENIIMLILFKLIA